MPELKETFRHMSRRRAERCREGTIESRDAASVVALLGMSMFFFGLTHVLFPREAPVSAARMDDKELHAAVLLLGGLCACSACLPRVRPRRVLRCLLAGLALTLLGSLACLGPRHAACTHFHLPLALLVCAALLGLFAEAYVHRLRCQGRSSDRLWRDVQVHGSHFSYAEGGCGAAARRFFLYEGELDAQGVPHGTGTWSDSGTHGEVLHGLWREGRPVAPFRSSDYSTGYAFEAVRVGLASNRREAVHECRYAVHFRPLEWAVASVECSIAGKFFRCLPRAAVLQASPPHGQSGAAWCLSNMPTLQDPGDLPDEVVLLVHGFNCPTSDALCRMGQLWTLGAFPTHLKPFVFGWPGSRDVRYFSAVNAARSERMGSDFRAVLHKLHAGGARNVHVMAHSLGALILLHALRDAQDSGLRLRTVLLLNPDHSLQDFVESDFSRLAAVCGHVTLYADPLDGALWYSETFNRRPALGRRPFDVGHLDLDVVEVSWMDSNMHPMRHSFFDINQLMVQDIKEILTTRARASRRSNLLHRHSNVFSFLSAPKIVVNK